MRTYIYLTILFPVFVVAGELCDSLNSVANKDQVYLMSPRSAFTVTGTGRLFFHSAPDERCIQRDIFIIPGDQVNAYTEYSDFVSVMYIDSHGKDTEGWVKRDRLQEVKATEE